MGPMDLMAAAAETGATAAMPMAAMGLTELTAAMGGAAALAEVAALAPMAATATHDGIAPRFSTTPCP